VGAASSVHNHAVTDPNERSGADVIPLSRFRAALARPRGYRQLDALLRADDAAGAVAALSVPELYFLVKEVGFADAQELVALAAPEQIRGCLDMDVWERDQIQLDGVMPWLVALCEAGYEKLGEVWEALDPEFSALVLARATHIYDLSLGEEVPDDEERPVFLTPDRFFAVALTGEREDDIQLVHRVLDHLYRADMQLARHTILSARSEIPSQLEEMSYRWRAGRMADLGYVDYYEALEVFRPLDPDSVEPGENTADVAPAPEPGEEARAPGSLPVPVVERLAGRSFLARALDGISEAAEAERLEAALLYLVNRVLAAARVSPGDEEGMAIGAEHASATLSLGLEQVARGDLGLAREALRTISLTRLHRVGYTLSLRLARFARVLAPRSATAGDRSSAVLAALLAARPFFPRVLDEPESAEGVRPLASLEDLGRVARHLSALALRIAVADALGVDLVAMREAPEPRPELDDHVRTSLVRHLGGGELDPAPLSAGEIERFRTGPLSAGTLSEEARTNAGRALLATLDRAGVVAGRDILPALLGQWLRDLEETFASLPRGARLDPRFVSGVLLGGDFN
jgi:hypothetical protein